MEKNAKILKKTMDSLGGKSTPARGRGAHSSRASSAIFKKLQKLDRKISKLDQQISRSCYFLKPKDLEKEKVRRQILDQKRKETREERKNGKKP